MYRIYDICWAVDMGPSAAHAYIYEGRCISCKHLHWHIQQRVRHDAWLIMKSKKLSYTKKGSTKENVTKASGTNLPVAQCMDEAQHIPVGTSSSYGSSWGCIIGSLDHWMQVYRCKHVNRCFESRATATASTSSKYLKTLRRLAHGIGIHQKCPIGTLTILKFNQGQPQLLLTRIRTCSHNSCDVSNRSSVEMSDRLIKGSENVSNVKDT